MSSLVRKTRVLVVDDSVVSRRFLSKVLAEDEEIEVVGTAPNGRIALEKIPQLNPDVVTLDLEMPEMDGLATFSELRKTYPKLPVIMISSLIREDMVERFDVFSRGVTDFVMKPFRVSNVETVVAHVREQLAPKIKALSQAAHRATGASASESRPRVRPQTTSHSLPYDLLVIGASTGGPRALAQILTHLPADFPVPIVIVQHMPPVFTKQFATRLDQVVPLDVSEATEGAAAEPGRVLIAPGDYHLTLSVDGSQWVCRLHQSPPENSCRPAVDVLFRSAAEVAGSNCLGLVLTGMGRDGHRGAEWIVSAGGTVLAQDEATSVVWGMPRAVIEAGLADAVLPIHAMPAELIRRIHLRSRATTVC